MAIVENEEAIAYDSQVIKAPVTLDGTKKNATLIRIGRVFLFADTGEAVYMYDPKHKKYRSDLSLGEKRTIRLAADIITGKKAPELVALPVRTETLQVTGAQ